MHEIAPCRYGLWATCSALVACKYLGPDALASHLWRSAGFPRWELRRCELMVLDAIGWSVADVSLLRPDDGEREAVAALRVAVGSPVRPRAGEVDAARAAVRWLADGGDDPPSLPPSASPFADAARSVAVR